MPSLLCFVAHPDDETRLCGGLLAKLAAQGVTVHLLCLTRGEGGEMGEPPLTTRVALGPLREQEMRCAAGKLGAATVTFLDYVDPTVGPDDELSAPEHDANELKAQLTAAIHNQQPAVVLTHGSNGEYGHPAHLLVHNVTSAVVRALDGAAPLFYSFAACFPEHPYKRLTNEDDMAHLVVDVSAHLEQVIAAAECHRTQHALFVRRLSELHERSLSVPEVIRLTPQEGLYRHWPPVNGQLDDLLWHWLEE